MDLLKTSRSFGTAGQTSYFCRVVFIKQTAMYTSKIVTIGNLQLGGDLPVRLQSMTSTQTLDTGATVDQAVRMIRAGCELVRITAPGLKEAAHLKEIRSALRKQGYNVPLIADIHFNPAAAEVAARLVEKVRINPGNYTGSRQAGSIDYSEAEYQAELDKTAVRLLPLLKICKEYGTAIRIGTNHGSLSQRIVNRYGDTPEGMVQSALEFTRICHQWGFHNLVLSMKSSNVRVMVEAYRLLAEKLSLEGLNYPLHLGVTEAGDGDDARLKSVAGIGALLARGIGDTIRVSLTEDPENELPVARAIVERFHERGGDGRILRKIRPDLVADTGRIIAPQSSNSGMAFRKPAAVYLKKGTQIYRADHPSSRPVYAGEASPEINPALCSPAAFLLITEEAFSADPGKLMRILTELPGIAVLAEGGTRMLRNLAAAMQQEGLLNTLILKNCQPATGKDELLTEISLNPGSLLIDGIGNGICIENEHITDIEAVETGFGLLQATRVRISKTEFIACPSCGRTLFNIQQALNTVKSLTAHLNGLKIAVMGCIVNGPGEMADADYGYIGAGNGKVNLYKGKEAVSKGIPETEAPQALIALIKENGDWKEPE